MLGLEPVFSYKYIKDHGLDRTLHNIFIKAGWGGDDATEPQRIIDFYRGDHPREGVSCVNMLGVSVQLEEIMKIFANLRPHLQVECCCTEF